MTQPSALPTRFDPLSIALHWASVILIVALFASAWSLGLATDGVAAGRLLTLHRSLGATLLALALFRLAWRVVGAVRPPLPASTAAPQVQAAAISEYALYALMLVQPLTGLAQSLTRGRPFQLFAAEVPKLMARDKPLTGRLHDLHEWGAWLFLALIALHVAAALFHRFVQKDDVLQSMTPWPQKMGPQKNIADPGINAPRLLSHLTTPSSGEAQ